MLAPETRSTSRSRRARACCSRAAPRRTAASRPAPGRPCPSAGFIDLEAVAARLQHLADHGAHGRRNRRPPARGGATAHGRRTSSSACGFSQTRTGLAIEPSTSKPLGGDRRARIGRADRNDQRLGGSRPRAASITVCRAIAAAFGKSRKIEHRSCRSFRRAASPARIVDAHRLHATSIMHRRLARRRPVNASRSDAESDTTSTLERNEIVAHSQPRVAERPNLRPCSQSLCGSASVPQNTRRHMLINAERIGNLKLGTTASASKNYQLQTWRQTLSQAMRLAKPAPPRRCDGVVSSPCHITLRAAHERADRPAGHGRRRHRASSRRATRSSGW